MYGFPRLIVAVLFGIMIAAGTGLIMTTLKPLPSPKGSAVEKKGVHFETLVPDRVWRIPVSEPGTKNPIKLGLHITNKTYKPMRFCRFDTLFPDMIGPNGKRLQLDGGRNASRLIRESDCPIVKSGESVTFYLDGTLTWQNNKLRLGGPDGFGGLWYFDGLKPGMYKIRFIYHSIQEMIQIDRPEKKILENIWTGQVATPLVKVLLN